jgi:hypothetical protein
MPTATSRVYRWIKLELSNTDSTTIQALCEHCQSKAKLVEKDPEKLLEQVKKFETLHCMCSASNKGTKQQVS